MKTNLGHCKLLYLTKHYHHIIQVQGQHLYCFPPVCCIKLAFAVYLNKCLCL